MDNYYITIGVGLISYLLYMFSGNFLINKFSSDTTNKNKVHLAAISIVIILNLRLFSTIMIAEGIDYWIILVIIISLIFSLYHHLNALKNN
jgi:hypothetical protein